VLEDRAILRALDMQRGLGVDVLTDGEYRRASFLGTMDDVLAGRAPADSDPDRPDPAAPSQAGFRDLVHAKVAQARRLVAQEASFLRLHAGAPFKVTVPSPNLFLTTAPQSEPPNLPESSRDARLAELTEIVRGELLVLGAEGVPYIQVDAPIYAHYLDKRSRARLRADGIDPDRALDAAIATDNVCLAAIRQEGMTLGIHICQSSAGGPWLEWDESAAVAEKLFQTLQVDRFLLEFDAERAGAFEPLRFVPRRCTVVLGLLDTTNGALESRDHLLRRIEEATRYLPLENLALSPRCGFASVAEGKPMTSDDQYRKLELVVATARSVWG
jgi:5-methyltetrahydropteroyltriglutamate--homocysteine methyltransferase